MKRIVAVEDLPFKDGDLVEVEWNKNEWYKAFICGITYVDLKGQIYHWIVEWINKKPFNTPWSVTTLPVTTSIRHFKE